VRRPPSLRRLAPPPGAGPARDRAPLATGRRRPPGAPTAGRPVGRPRGHPPGSTPPRGRSLR
jgi:hypothetical protein